MSAVLEDGGDRFRTAVGRVHLDEVTLDQSMLASFSKAERREAGRGRAKSSWAGRLAAKEAVRKLYPELSLVLADVEILPRLTDCAAWPRPCDLGHPPTVTLLSPGLEHLAGAQAISISHHGDVALAVALHVSRGNSPCERQPTRPIQRGVQEATGTAKVRAAEGGSRAVRRCA